MHLGHVLTSHASSQSKMTKPKVNRMAMVLAACFQNLACGGLIFGWAAISSSLLIASQEEGGPALSRGACMRVCVEVVMVATRPQE